MGVTDDQFFFKVLPTLFKLVTSLFCAGETGEDELCDYAGDGAAKESASWTALPYSACWWQATWTGEEAD